MVWIKINLTFSKNSLYLWKADTGVLLMYSAEMEFFLQLAVKGKKAGHITLLCTEKNAHIQD